MENTAFTLLHRRAGKDMVSEPTCQVEKTKTGDELTTDDVVILADCYQCFVAVHYKHALFCDKKLRSTIY